MSVSRSGSGTLVGLFRYPVKGLSPEALDKVIVSPGEALPFDRAFAIENGAGRFDPEQPKFLPKINFLMLMRNERLATLRTRFDDTNQTLIIERAGKLVTQGNLGTPIGRRIIEQFMAAYMQQDLRGHPRIVSAPGHCFADCGEAVAHIVNLASVRDLEQTLHRPVDPLRFRANFIVDGFPAWSELEWPGKMLKVGAARIAITARTQRCDATNVDPSTGIRDLGLPRHIERQFGHADFGVYGRIIVGTPHHDPLVPGVAVELAA